MGETIEELGRRLGTTRELGSVVTTMKALAAVSIRRFERAAESLEEYIRTVELGLRAVVRARPGFLARARLAAEGGAVAALVLGSDQGMCGSLNEQVAGRALEALDGLPAPAEQRWVLAVGERVRARLEDAGQTVHAFLNAPSSVGAITPAVQDVLLRLDQWQGEHRVQRVFAFHARQSGGAAYRPVERMLLPMDRRWLAELSSRPWPTNQLPMLAGEWEGTFSALARQFLLAAVFRAFADSLASENASRLAAMQGAERNIEERLDELTNAYNQARQRAITEELLDIAAGFEALQGEAGRGERS